MTPDGRAIVGITMGDPAGVGPEIAAKAASDPRVSLWCAPLVVGDADVMRQAVRITGVRLAIRPVTRVAEASFKSGTLDVLDLANVDAGWLERGKVSALAGRAAFEAIRRVIELAMAREVDATVTGPINKESLSVAGLPYAGHTEIYAALTGAPRFCMMLVAGTLRVAHVSTHLSLRQACDRVKRDRVLEVISLTHEGCLRLGVERPRIAVAGLNPHAGESGLFGREEIEEITPAVKRARAEGMNAEGPLPADTVFAKARGGHYDAVVAMYHDQGHIPLKMEGFRIGRQSDCERVSGVNITLGLPIIRVSVDHGTAFDKAGKGTASPESLLEAIQIAAAMAREEADIRGGSRGPR